MVSTADHNDPGRRPDLVSVDRGLLPILERHIAHVAQRIVEAPPAVRCPHLGPNDCGVACGQHPARGIACPTCTVEHTDRHTHACEHTCDQCQGRDETMHTLIATPWVMVDTVNTRGETAIYAGPLQIVCVGVCSACAEIAGLPNMVATRGR